MQSIAIPKNRPHHVHGAVYLLDERVRLGLQPKKAVQSNLSDHQLDRYSGAVAANCERHPKRQELSGASQHILTVLLYNVGSQTTYIWQVAAKQTELFSQAS